MFDKRLGTARFQNAKHKASSTPFLYIDSLPQSYPKARLRQENDCKLTTKLFILQIFLELFYYIHFLSSSCTYTIKEIVSNQGIHINKEAHLGDGLQGYIFQMVRYNEDACYCELCHFNWHNHILAKAELASAMQD